MGLVMLAGTSSMMFADNTKQFTLGSGYSKVIDGANYDDTGVVDFRFNQKLNDDTLYGFVVGVRGVLGADYDVLNNIKKSRSCSCKPKPVCPTTKLNPITTPSKKEVITTEKESVNKTANQSVVIDNDIYKVYAGVTHEFTLPYLSDYFTSMTLRGMGGIGLAIATEARDYPYLTTSVDAEFDLSEYVSNVGVSASYVLDYSPDSKVLDNIVSVGLFYSF